MSEYKMSHTGAELDEAIAKVLNGEYTPSGNGGGDSVFIVNAIGTILIDFETLIVAPSSIVSVDKTVNEIMAAAHSGKLVYMSFDASDSWYQAFGDTATLKLWMPITVSNSNVDVVFGGLFDLSGSGIPIVVRIQGVLETNEWNVAAIPIVANS